MRTRLLARTLLLAAIGSIGLAGCCCCGPYCRNAPEYDASQYGMGPRWPYGVSRGYVGLACYKPVARPYHVAPRGAMPPPGTCCPAMTVPAQIVPRPVAPAPLVPIPQASPARVTGQPVVGPTAANDLAIPTVRAF